MSAVTSPVDVDRNSYFLTAHRRVVSEPDSPSISPSTHPSSAPARPTRRPRPPVRPHSRPRSDDISGYSRFPVQTIHENEASHNRAPFLSIETSTHRASRTSAATPGSDTTDTPYQRDRQSIATSQRTSSSYASVRSIACRYLQRFNPTSQIQNVTAAPNTRRRPIQRRARSDSAARRSRSLHSLPRRTTRSVETLARRRFRDSSESHRSAASPSIPLRPPISTNVSEHALTYRHDIKLETPFSPLPTHFLEARLCNESPSSRRPSPVHPRTIFSSPLHMVRKLRKPSNTNPAVPIERSSSPSFSETHGRMLGHVSQLRRKRTHEALRQVSQLLRLISGDKPDGLPVEPKTIYRMSTKSTPSLKEFKEGRKSSRKPTQGLPTAPVRISTQKSMELDLPDSDSSSIRDIRLGPPPNATPEPHATYKVKRSPSAETEEFLKVDISIRGGTSYLPSEARRIHTPPLPGEGAGGKRRGFFFDYDAPSLSIDAANAKNTGSADGNPTVVRNSGTDKAQGCWSNPSSSGRSVQSTTLASIPVARTASKHKAMEWFDAQFAELDASTDEEILNRAKSKYGASLPGFSELRLRTAQALQDMHTRNSKLSGKDEVALIDAMAATGQDEEIGAEEEVGEIDYNVPEHYPTSPLCPANVKYWRFVDGKLRKGRYTRTCWMHGESKI